MKSIVHVFSAVAVLVGLVAGISAVQTTQAEIPVIELRAQVAQLQAQLVAVQAQANAPQAVVVGTSTLNLSYDANNKESSLVSEVKVRVTAGAVDAKLLNIQTRILSTTGKTAGYSQYQLIASSAVRPESSDYGLLYVVPARTTGEFTVRQTYSPAQMFPGTYNNKAQVLTYLNPIASSSEAVLSGDVTQGAYATATVVGETSPYINDAVAGVSGAVASDLLISGKMAVLKGERLNNAQFYLDGQLVARPADAGASTDGKTLSFTVPTTWSIGRHAFQVANTNGKSNLLYVTITAQSVNPSVDMVPTASTTRPVLKLMYDSNNKESMLIAYSTTTITAARGDVYLPLSPIRVSYQPLNAQYSTPFPNASTRFLSTLPVTTSSNGISYYILTKGQSISVLTASQVPAKNLFAGTYITTSPVQVNYYLPDGKAGTELFLNAEGFPVAQSNAVTVIGETAPYISGAFNGTSTTSGADLVVSGKMTVLKGERLNNASFYFDGQMVARPTDAGASTDGKTLSFTVPTTWALGRHALQVANANGLSNYIYITIVSSSNPGAESHSVSVGKSAVNVNEQITVFWNATTANNKLDWIGVFKVGATNQQYGAWAYVNTFTGSTTLKAPATPGQYEVRYLKNNGYTSVATSEIFTVKTATSNSGPTGTLSVNRGTTPVLTLGFDGTKETSLYARATTTLSAVGGDVWVHPSVLEVQFNGPKGSYSYGSSRVISVTPNITLDPAGYYILKNGTSATFTVVSSIDTRALFAGSHVAQVRYALSVQPIGIAGEIFNTVNRIDAGSPVSNSVVIIGETSPYVDTLKTTVSGQVLNNQIIPGKLAVITGTRLTGVQFYIDGVKITRPADAGVSTDGKTLSFTIPTSVVFGAAKDGQHLLQVENANGKSNYVTFTVGTTTGSPASITLPSRMKTGDTVQVSWTGISAPIESIDFFKVQDGKVVASYSFSGRISPALVNSTYSNKIYETAPAGTYYANLSTYNSVVVGTSSTFTIEKPVVGNSNVTVTVPAITTTVAPNTANVKIGSYSVIPSATVGNTFSSIGVVVVNPSFIGNLKVVSQGKTYGPIAPNATNTISTNIQVPVGSSPVTIDIYADTMNTSGAVTTQLWLGNLKTQGQTVIISNSATLSVQAAINQSSVQASQYQVGGASPVIATYKLTSTSSPVTVEELAFTNAGAGVLESITIGVNGQNFTRSVAGATTTFSGLNISVPAGYGGVNVTVAPKYASVDALGNPSNKTSTISLGYIKARSGNFTKYFYQSVPSNTMTIVGSRPTVALMQGAATINNGLTEIAQVKVTADAAGSVRVKTLPIQVNVHVGAEAYGQIGSATYPLVVRSANGEVIAFATSTALKAEDPAVSGLWISRFVMINFGEGYEIPAGQSETFRIYATTQKSSEEGQLTVSLRMPSLYWDDVKGNVKNLNGSLIPNPPAGISIFAVAPMTNQLASVSDSSLLSVVSDLAAALNPSTFLANVAGGWDVLWNGNF